MSAFDWSMTRWYKTHATGWSCSANQQNVTLLNMTINTVGSLNLSTLFGALFIFSAFIETLDFFSLKKYVLRSLNRSLISDKLTII
jgi:hypothetical protein